METRGDGIDAQMESSHREGHEGSSTVTAGLDISGQTWCGQVDFLTVPKFHRDEAHQLTVGTVA